MLYEKQSFSLAQCFCHMLALGRWAVKICCFLQSRSKHCPCLDRLFRRYMEVAVITWRNKGKTGQVCRLFHWKKIPTYDFYIQRSINISLLFGLMSADCSDELDRCGVCFVNSIKHHVSACVVLIWLLLSKEVIYYGKGPFASAFFISYCF